MGQLQGAVQPCIRVQVVPSNDWYVHSAPEQDPGDWVVVVVGAGVVLQGLNEQFIPGFDEYENHEPPRTAQLALDSLSLQAGCPSIK